MPTAVECLCCSEIQQVADWQILQEVSSAPPLRDIPTLTDEDTHTNERECEVDMSPPVPSCDVGVQVVPGKKNA